MKNLTFYLTAFLASVLGGAQAFAQVGEGYGYGRHPHMWGDGWGGGMIFGPIILIVVIVIIALIVMGVMRMGRCHGHRCHHRRGGSDAVSILEERFARGEIEADEFEKRRKMLTEQ